VVSPSVLARRFENTRRNSCIQGIGEIDRHLAIAQVFQGERLHAVFSIGDEKLKGALPVVRMACGARLASMAASRL